ncbi:MAG: rod shape-determining protein RodA [Armatimonadetes bacterium]|nr:rod shape-determining protein RodA [Armatimonadota bacterium]
MYRPWWTRLNFQLIIASLLLCAYGLVAVYSANFRVPHSTEFTRQTVFFFLGLTMFLVVLLMDYHTVGRLSLYLYGINVILLLAVMFFGHSALGAQRWVSLGPLGSFQPSELAKLFLIITLARQLSSSEDPRSLKTLGLALLHAAPPLLLILLQPDLGTALVLVTILFGLLLAAGTSPVYILLFVVSGLAVAPHILKEYQVQRLLVFLNPQADPQGAGWNIIQSEIAVGCGQLVGKGLFAGTQAQLKFVPEKSTDFIFTVIGEELGFIGAIALLALYLVLLWQITRIAMEARDVFGRLVATGIGVMLFFHVLVNIGMTIGIMPITGIPLPFISYGGTSLLTNMTAIGFLLNIHMRKDRLLPEE